MLYLIVVLIYSLVVKTTAPYEEEEDHGSGFIVISSFHCHSYMIMINKLNIYLTWLSNYMRLIPN